MGDLLSSLYPSIGMSVKDDSFGFISKKRVSTVRYYLDGRTIDEVVARTLYLSDIVFIYASKRCGAVFNRR